jgi:signal transduction histidine kinase
VQSARFVVDASIIQELGERLIGRPAIALGELVKNSYDADATTCLIEFADDQIVVSDDGDGMSETEFRNYWMRIGTTHKIDERLSKSLGRPMTGSKGIGRLSVQYLADQMILESSCAAQPGNHLYVIIDWRSVVRGAHLDTVNVQWDIVPGTPQFPGGHPTGARLTLTTLKSRWDADALESLGREVWMLRSPFRRSAKAPVSRRREDFQIEIEAPAVVGARDAFDKVMETLFSNWKARIRGSLDSGRSGGGASISVEFRPNYPENSEKEELFRESVSLPVRRRDLVDQSLVDRAKFEILIFKPEGRQPGGISVTDLRDYLSEFGNVSVYDAGFRLPYYGAAQDWLAIAVDQGRRIIASELLPEHLKIANRYMLDLPAPGRIFGAVEIDTNHERTVAGNAGSLPGEWLQIQPGRDRLHDNRAFEQLRDLVRFSLDFYANRYRLLAVQSVEKRRKKEPSSIKFRRAIEVLERSRDEMPAMVWNDIRRELVDARDAAAVEEETLDQRAALLAPLATAGMAALALNHEISRETRFLDRVGEQLRRIASTHSIPELATIADEFGEVRSRLDSLQELFFPLISDVDKAATDRLLVRAVVDQSVRSMRVLMPRVIFRTAGVPSNLRFPLGSLAEWNAVLQNVLSNAWNALLDSSEWVISFAGGRDRRGKEWLHVSDTGSGLDIPLSDASRLFEPFERAFAISDERRSIALGGQGLGLAIVRMIAHRRSAEVAFVEPESGFSTTVEISWWGSKR